jgi:hypothetical protein
MSYMVLSFLLCSHSTAYQDRQSFDCMSRAGGPSDVSAIDVGQLCTP